MRVQHSSFKIKLFLQTQPTQTHSRTRAGLVDVLIHMQNMYELEAERSHDSLTAGLRYITAGKHAGGCMPKSIIHLLNNLPKIRVGGAAPWTGPTQRDTHWPSHCHNYSNIITKEKFNKRKIKK